MNEYASDTGQALSDTADEFAHLPLSAIVTSPTNPRKTFDAAKLAELAASITASGVHQPVLVRPLPGHRVADTDRGVAYELVAGERRYRASKQAGVPTIPALIRNLTDHQVLEIQLTENLQRDDLSELEEAEGYEQLCEATGITKDQVGAKIGKSRAYVYGRLKLLDLSFECKQAMRAGLIDASRALLIARIPDTALQTKALAEATRKDHQGDVCSVRALQGWLQANVMLRLDKATFKTTDSQLITKAGKCTNCPKRTGASPDLFVDVSSADICIDPACYHAKTDAQRNKVMGIAAARGMRLIEGKEAQEICSKVDATIHGYTPLTQERQDVAHGAQVATLGDLLGSDGPERVLIENPWTHELIACVPTADAEALLLARGLVKASAKKDNTPRDLEHEIKRLQTTIERNTDKAYRAAAYGELLKVIHATSADQAPALITPALVRAWLIWMQDNEVANSIMAEVLDITLGAGSDEDDTLRLRLQACDHATLYRTLAGVMISNDKHAPFFGEAEQPTLIDAMARDQAVNLTAIHAKAAATVKAETAEQLRDLKAAQKAATQASQDPPKHDLPHAPLAQPMITRGSAQGTGDKPTRGPLRKPKLSADEAKSGIAAAMQGIERGATARPESTQAQLSVGFAIGQKVTVLDSDRLRQPLRKYIGKTGSITAKLGDRAWDVSFKGRAGGLASFDVSEIEVVAA